MYSEKDPAKIFKQLMNGISYYHSKGIGYRDLKPENILFLTNDDNSPIKIIDFDLIKFLVKQKKDDKKKKKKKNKITKVGISYYVQKY